MFRLLLSVLLLLLTGETFVCVAHPSRYFFSASAPTPVLGSSAMPADEPAAQRR